MKKLCKLIINDFQSMFWTLEKETKTSLKQQGTLLWFLLCLDWLICSVIIGEKNNTWPWPLQIHCSGPADILFWRAVWETNREILDINLFDHDLLKRFNTVLFLLLGRLTDILNSNFSFLICQNLLYSFFRIPLPETEKHVGQFIKWLLRAGSLCPHNWLLQPVLLLDRFCEKQGIWETSRTYLKMILMIPSFYGRHFWWKTPFYGRHALYGRNPNGR